MTNNLSLQLKDNAVLLSGTCSFDSVAKLDIDKTLLPLLQSNCVNVRVDLSGIQNSSSAIFPLLLQIKRSAAMANKPALLEAIPERLLAMIQLAELDNILLN